MTLLSRRILTVAWLAATGLIAGCATKELPVEDFSGATITGTVVESGKPVKHLPNETINVGLMMIEGEGADKTSFGAEVKPEDGTFTVNGPTGKGIPPGRYKVTLNSNVYGGGDDRFEAAFAATGTAQMIAEVGPNPDQSFVIDIKTKKVRKK